MLLAVTVVFARPLDANIVSDCTDTANAAGICGALPCANCCGVPVVYCDPDEQDFFYYASGRTAAIAGFVPVAGAQRPAQVAGKTLAV